jgi:hypothetical protein
MFAKELIATTVLLCALSFVSNCEVVAQQGQLPPNTLPCEAFTKRADGTWFVRGPVTFDVGSAKGMTLENQVIPPGFMRIGGIDLYVLLERKCVARR